MNLRRKLILLITGYKIGRKLNYAMTSGVWNEADIFYIKPGLLSPQEHSFLI